MDAAVNRVVFVSNNFFQTAYRFQGIDADWTFAQLCAKCGHSPLVYFSHRCAQFASSQKAERAWRRVVALGANPKTRDLKRDPVVGTASDVLGLLVYDAWLKAVTLAGRSVLASVRLHGVWGRGQDIDKLNAGMYPGLTFYGIIRLAQRRGMPAELARLAFKTLLEAVYEQFAPNLNYASIIQGVILGACADAAIEKIGIVDVQNKWKFNYDAKKALASVVYAMHVQTAKRSFKDVHWFELRNLAAIQAQGLLTTSLTRITNREPKSLGILSRIHQENNIMRAKKVPSFGVFRLTSAELVHLAELSWRSKHGATAKAAWDAVILAIAGTTPAWTSTSAIASKCYSGTNRLAKLVADRLNTLGSRVPVFASAMALSASLGAIRGDETWDARVKRHRPTDHLGFLHSAYARLPANNRFYAITTAAFSTQWRCFLLSMERAARTGHLEHLPVELLHLVAWFASPTAVTQERLATLLKCTVCFVQPAITSVCKKCSA